MQTLAMGNPQTLSAHEKREVITRSDVAEQTLRKYLRGQPVREASARRIERALAELARERSQAAAPTLADGE